MSHDSATGHVGSDTDLLDAHVVVQHPGLHLDLTLRAAPGTVIALLGPNGAGKTTLLHAIAGLMPLSAGHITVGGLSWADATGALEPRRRSCGLLAADHLLFPHLDALRNVAFGPRARGTDVESAQFRARKELDALHILDLADRRPGQLSHGQHWPPTRNSSCSTSRSRTWTPRSGQASARTSRRGCGPSPG